MACALSALALAASLMLVTLVLLMARVGDFLECFLRGDVDLSLGMLLCSPEMIVAALGTVTWFALLGVTYT